MGEVQKRTLRVKLDTSLELFTALALQTWRGNALDLEIGINDADGVASISNISSVNVKVQTSQTNNTTLMDSTVAAADMDSTLTAATWENGTKQHATFSFTNAQTNLTLGDGEKDFWIVFTALLTGGETVTLGAGFLTVHEDNDTTAGDPDVNPGTAITLEQADARYYKEDDDAILGNLTADSATLTSSALTSGAAISWDASAIAQPTLTLGENATLTLSGLADGQTVSLGGVMGGSGTHTLAIAHAGLTVREMGGALTDIAALDVNDLFEVSIKRVGTDMRCWVSTLEI